jgi:hypothetical protein
MELVICSNSKGNKPDPKIPIANKFTLQDLTLEAEGSISYSNFVGPGFNYEITMRNVEIFAKGNFAINVQNVWDPTGRSRMKILIENCSLCVGGGGVKIGSFNLI